MTGTHNRAGKSPPNMHTMCRKLCRCYDMQFHSVRSKEGCIMIVWCLCLELFCYLDHKPDQRKPSWHLSPSGNFQEDAASVSSAPCLFHPCRALWDAAHFCGTNLSRHIDPVCWWIKTIRSHDLRIYLHSSC